MPEPDEIDRIIAKAMHPQIWGTGRCEGDGAMKAHSQKIAVRLRVALKAAGYVIVEQQFPDGL